MAGRKKIFYEFRNKQVPMSALVEELGKSKATIKNMMDGGITPDNIAKGDTDLLKECTKSQMGLINNPEAVINFGLEGIYKIVKGIKDRINIFYLNDSAGFALKYYMDPKEFNFLKEQLSVGLDPEFLRENKRFVFSVHSINIEVEKVSFSVAKKIKKTLVQQKAISA